MTMRSEIPASADVASLQDLVALLKPRVMSLVVFTGAIGLAIAPGEPHPLIAAVAVLCIAVGAGASAAINMWYDRDIDRLMSRTQARPIPAGRIEPGTALGLGIALAVGSTTLMGIAVNWLAAGLLAFTIFFYVVIYTVWLKRRTPQNIVIGGAAGAFPPMIGWAASAGELSIAPLVLFGIIFLWTPPHFWALALYRHDDYARAGVPMLPVVAGDANTRWQILGYTIALVPLSLAPVMIGFSGALYGIGAAILGLLFLCGAIQVLRNRGVAVARRLFGYSIVYLFALFVLLIADQGLPLALPW